MRHARFYIQNKKKMIEADRIPVDVEFQEDLWVGALGAGSQLAILEDVPLLVAVAYPEDGDADFADEVDAVVAVLVVHRHLQHRVDVLHVTINSKKRM